MGWKPLESRLEKQATMLWILGRYASASVIEEETEDYAASFHMQCQPPADNVRSGGSTASSHERSPIPYMRGLPILTWEGFRTPIHQRRARRRR